MATAGAEALERLQSACSRALTDLESIQHDNTHLPFGRFDQRSWRTRLGKVPMGGSRVLMVACSL